MFVRGCALFVRSFATNYSSVEVRCEMNKIIKQRDYNTLTRWLSNASFLLATLLTIKQTYGSKILIIAAKYHWGTMGHSYTPVTVYSPSALGMAILTTPIVGFIFGEGVHIWSKHGY